MSNAAALKHLGPLELQAGEGWQQLQHLQGEQRMSMM
jgi:hypothetical protein